MERRAKVFNLLNSLNCTYATDQAGLFVWAKIPPSFTSGYELSDEVLYKYSVFITPGGIFGSAGEGYVRVSLCTPAEHIQRAIERITQ
jgi:LL-diaminopimelate aminotransferase